MFDFPLSPEVDVRGSGRGLAAALDPSLTSSPRFSGQSRDDYQRRRQSAELAKIEEELVTAHRRPFVEAAALTANAPERVDVGAIRKRLEDEQGVTALAAELSEFGSPPKAPPAEPIDHGAWIKARRKEAVRMVPILRFGEQRRVAEESRLKTEAEIAAEEETRRGVAAAEQARLDQAWQDLQTGRARTTLAAEKETESETARRAAAHKAERERLDRDWHLLQTNDPTTVLAAVERALADNAAPAAALGCKDETLSLAMKFGPPDLVPERRADYTPTGKPTTKKRTKTEINELYLAAMASHALATVNEALAAAPTIGKVALGVVREEGAEGLSMIYAGRFSRGGASLWTAADHPSDDLARAQDAMLDLGGRTNEVKALDLAEEPELRAALSRMADVLGLEPWS